MWLFGHRRMNFIQCLCAIVQTTAYFCMHNVVDEIAEIIQPYGIGEAALFFQVKKAHQKEKKISFRIIP